MTNAPSRVDAARDAARDSGAAPPKLRLEGVGKRFDKHFDRKWLEGETRGTRLVVIGQDLDQAAITNELKTALA